MYVTSDNPKFEYESEAIEHEIELEIYDKFGDNPSNMQPWEYIFTHRKVIHNFLSTACVSYEEDRIDVLWRGEQ